MADDDNWPPKMEIVFAPSPAGSQPDDSAWFVQHIKEHIDGHENNECPYCQVRPLLKDLRAVWDGDDQDKFELMWSLSDGYGEPGLIPSQGYDWSGVRDSSPAAIRAMWNAIR